MMPNWVCLLLAPFVGSFVGVLIERLPAERQLLWARSECGSCHAKLAAIDLLPLLSYLLLHGRCRQCGAQIGRFHLWIEVAALGVALVSYALLPDPAELWGACLLGWWGLALGVIDARHFILPDVLTLSLVLAGFLWGVLVDPSQSVDRAMGALAGFGFLHALAWGYRRWRGREGLGEGDARLLAAGGAWLGWAALPDVLLVAALLGLVGFLTVARSSAASLREMKLPFGPCLAAAIWLVWVGQCVLQD
jgi:leader peptidase (prepilin peptidase)/N-methyltransferase